MANLNKVTRRRFLGWSAAAGGAGALVASGAGDALSKQFLGIPAMGQEEADEKIVWAACTVNCGSRCPVRLKVRDGQIVQVMAYNTGDAELGTQQIRACVRGRSIRHRVYNPDRLKTPLKRKPGTKRGDGEWIEISWDQALDEIAEKMKDIKSTYGNEAFYLQAPASSGRRSRVPGRLSRPRSRA